MFLPFPHARYAPLGERAMEVIAEVCVIMLPICLWDKQSHSETDEPAEHAMNLPVDAIDGRDWDSWIGHSEEEDPETLKQMIFP